MRRYPGALWYLNNHHLAIIIKGHKRRAALVADIGIEYRYPGVAIMPLVGNTLDEWRNHHIPEGNTGKDNKHPYNEGPPPGSTRLLFNNIQWFCLCAVVVWRHCRHLFTSSHLVAAGAAVWRLLCNLLFQLHTVFPFMILVASSGVITPSLIAWASSVMASLSS